MEDISDAKLHYELQRDVQIFAKIFTNFSVLVTISNEK